MRLIDLDEFFRQNCIDRMDGKSCEECKHHVLEVSCERLMEQPTIDPVKWIPVSERLPEKNGRYLVTCEQWGAWEVDWNIWYMTPRPGWLWEKGITAWMPLPEPWRGEEDETD